MAAGILVAAAMAAPAFAQELTIIAPAAPGGGWDQTARSLQAALQTEGLAKNVQVINVPGAGGTIGLAQFVSQRKGDPKALIVGGYVMVGAILTNASPVTLDQVTPIARLTGEYEAIVVPTTSPIKTIGDLVAQLKADPGTVSWGGGSAGGTDHITVGLIAKAAGVDPTKINYIPFSGGGEALAAIVGGKVTAGISGYGEFEQQVKAGKLRVLAVSPRAAAAEYRRADAQGIAASMSRCRTGAAFGPRPASRPSRRRASSRRSKRSSSPRPGRTRSRPKAGPTPSSRAMPSPMS